jgi:hypothetical protein
MLCIYKEGRRRLEANKPDSSRARERCWPTPDHQDLWSTASAPTSGGSTARSARHGSPRYPAWTGIAARERDSVNIWCKVEWVGFPDAIYTPQQAIRHSKQCCWPSWASCWSHTITATNS